ncbi:hypothetical protein WJX77_011355 [Trebouxia sp. C0004]
MVKTPQTEALINQVTLPSSLYYCCGDDSTGGGPMQGPHSKCVLMPLSDLVHQIPRLLELMPSECLAALIATSTTHRTEIAKGEWHLLVGLYFGRAKLTRAVVQELVAANWPALNYLSSVEMPIDMGIISLLSQAHWPQLAFLNLLNVRLPSTKEGDRTLALSYNGLGTVAMSYLAQGKWPLLEMLNLRGNELEDTALDQLFTGKWPLLKELKLTVGSLRDQGHCQVAGSSFR